MRAGQQWEVCAARARHRPSGSTAGERLLSDGAAGLPGRHFRGANGWAWLARQRLIALLSTLSGARVEVEAVGGARSPQCQCSPKEQSPFRGDPVGSLGTELALWEEPHFFPGTPVPGRSRRWGSHRVLHGETPSRRGRAVPNSLGAPSGIRQTRGRRAPITLRAAERPEERTFRGHNPCPGWGRLPGESSWPAGRRRATPKPAGGEHFKASGCRGWAPEWLRVQRGTGRRSELC